MKRVETININGIVFSIDDDAFRKLTSYLDTLGRYFENEQGGREIIADIEARIAELFSARPGENVQVVTITDVNNAIETLGTPEDIAGTDHEADPDTARYTVPPIREKTPKRLYRDPDHRYLGGVCSGIAAWLGINPIIIRLFFIIITCFYGISILFYFLLWIIVPLAKTTSQKLEMRGEPVTISNIEKNIRENMNTPHLKQSFNNFIGEAGEIFNKIFGVIGRIFRLILGIALFLAGIGICIAIGSAFFMQDFIFSHEIEWDFFSFNELLQHIISPVSYDLLWVCGIIIIGLVVLACIFWGIKLITNYKIRYKIIHVSLLILWFAAIITLLVTSFSQARNYAWNNELTETIQLNAADTLYLSASQIQTGLSNNPLDIYFDKEKGAFYGKPELRIYKSDDNHIRLKTRKEAQGKNKLAAYRYAEDISYKIDIRDSLFVFPSHFTVEPQNKWQFQTLSVTLYIPEGTVVIADNKLCHDRILGRWFRYRNDGCIWIMTDKGLRPPDK